MHIPLVYNLKLFGVTWDPFHSAGDSQASSYQADGMRVIWLNF